jgi:small conductance mechanosensitive channel
VAIVAALVSRWGRKAATAVITRITAPPGIAGSALEKIGVVSGPDPRDATRTRTLCAVARTTISTIVWTIAVLIILGIFQVDIGPLLAGAGIAGIAIGLGSQSLVRDCIAGFFMLLEDQCGVGDDIDIGTVAGRVEALTMRATTIRSVDGTLWTVPNGSILRVGNQSRTWAQSNVDIFLGHDRDLARATEVAQRAVAEVSAEPDVAEVLLREAQVLGVETVDSNGAVLRLAVRTRPGEQAHVARRMRLAVKVALDADRPA